MYNGNMRIRTNQNVVVQNFSCINSIQLVFCVRKLLQQPCIDMTSFCMQFKKRRRGLLQEAFWIEGECVCLKLGGKKRKSTGNTPMFTSVFQDRYFLFSL